MTAHSALASLSTANPTTNQARTMASIILVGTLGMVSSCAAGACFSQTSLVMRGMLLFSIEFASRAINEGYVALTRWLTSLRVC
jgi:hypothetical protein